MAIASKSASTARDYPITRVASAGADEREVHARAARGGLGRAGRFRRLWLLGPGLEGDPGRRPAMAGAGVALSPHDRSWPDKGERSHRVARRAAARAPAHARPG